MIFETYASKLVFLKLFFTLTAN